MSELAAESPPDDSMQGTTRQPEGMSDYVLGMAALSVIILALWLILQCLCERFCSNRGVGSSSEVAADEPGAAASCRLPLLSAQRAADTGSTAAVAGGGHRSSRTPKASAAIADSLTPRGTVTSSHARGRHNKHISVENYLCFLRTCRDMFAVLTGFSVFFTAPLWGFHPLLAGVLGGQASLTAPLSKGQEAEAGDLALPMVKTLYSMTLLYGIVFLAFTLRFQQACLENAGLVADTPEKRKMRRTLWLQRLPLSDGVWGAKEFEYTDEDLERVKMDLHAEIRKFVGERCPDQLTSPKVLRKQTTSDRAMSWHGGDGERYQDTPPGKFERSDKLAWDDSFCAGLRQSLSPIESIEVAPHIEELWRVSMSRRESAELAEMYASLCGKAAKSGLRLPRWCRRKWYGRQHRIFKEKTDELRAMQLCILLDSKRLSGSAFVTFTCQEACRLMLNKVPPWWDLNAWFFRNTFSFGRPPFAAVTLFVYCAPHPEDVNWQNLHTKSYSRRLRYWVLTFAVAVLTVALSAGVDTLKEQVGTGGSRLSTKLLSATPPVLLLIINNLILPYSIWFIALAERNRQKSNEELRQLYINFYFLVLTSIAVPFLGFETLGQLFEVLYSYLQRRPTERLSEQIGTKLLNTSGDFTLRYMVGAVFLSNPFVLLKVPLFTLVQFLRVRVLALPAREQRESQRPLPFAWGFWYAWVLIIAATGIIYGTVLPSLLPFMALFFASRHWVEDYNLRRGLIDPCTDSEGTYAAAAAYQLLIIGVAWWSLMGVFFLTICRQRNDCPAWLSPYGCGLLLLSPIIVLPVSWLRKRHAFLGLTASERLSEKVQDDREQGMDEDCRKLNWEATQVVEKDTLIEDVLRLLKVRCETDPKAREVVLQRLRGGRTVEEIRNDLLSGLQIDEPAGL